MRSYLEQMIVMQKQAFMKQQLLYRKPVPHNKTLIKIASGQSETDATDSLLAAVDGEKCQLSVVLSRVEASTTSLS